MSIVNSFATFFTKDISVSNQTTDLSVYEAGGAQEKTNGFRVSVEWINGTGAYTHQLTTNYTVGSQHKDVWIGKFEGKLVLELGTSNWIILKKEGYSSDPIGSIKAYAGTVAPEGYLLCQGAAISRSIYSKLFSRISTAFGVGDGSATFNVPDAVGASLSGAGTSTGYTQNETITFGAKHNDQFQGHLAGTSAGAFREANSSGGVGSTAPLVWDSSQSTRTQILLTDGTNGEPRKGNTTRGKILGVNFIIKVI